MSFFKSSKNQTASAAPSANTSPVQTPRSSMQASRPKDQQSKAIASEQALNKALNSSTAGGLIVPRPVMPD
ncbi:hypothetical protein BGZ94_003909 [Podila epigama]|nr:hypothetical protein BGZ94_003909 [Podila epigama]